ncbi:MAG: DUF2147 domain-containing protein [Bacteroidales bacterium]|jgi:uncharacterized protein (DUF2147 family)|nr:DUF2147 domain-containing protein [Bacteroidales bacterium]
MKRIQCFIILLISTLITPGLMAQEADQILGYWLTQDGDSQVKIFKASNGNYYGDIRWLEEPYEEDGTPKRDDENSDPKLQERTILGLQILKGFTYDAKDQEWVDGTIYDPKNGKTYSCYMWFEDGDNKILHVKGFIGFSMLGREVEWIREAQLRE